MSNVTVVTTQTFQKEVLEFPGVALVDFYADWCGPCRMLAPILEKLAEELKDNKNVKIAKVDTEANPDLAARYQITSIPNVILFKNGSEARQIIGLRGINDYKEAILKLMVSA